MYIVGLNIVTFSNPENALDPIDVTLAGIVTSVIEHPLKALVPIEVNFAGSSISVKLEQPLNA